VAVGPRDTARAPLAPLGLPAPEPAVAAREVAGEASGARRSPRIPSSPE
jgi:hypothetical protein